MMQLHIYIFTAFILISCCKCTRQTNLTHVGNEVESPNVTRSPGAKGEIGENDGLLKAFQQLQKELKECKDQRALRTQILRRKNCKQLQDNGGTSSGWYKIGAKSAIVDVYCDMETDGGGWLVFQRRSRGNTNFYRGWAGYRRGFGSGSGEWWLGLETLHRITSTGSYELLVELEDAQNNHAFAKYSQFSIGPGSSNYRLHVGGYNGTAGDSLALHNNRQFTTYDRDNDDSPYRNCANRYYGAWWYKDCHASNLNGEYVIPGANNPRGLDWYSWKDRHYSMKSTAMKIRPNN